LLRGGKGRHVDDQADGGLVEREGRGTEEEAPY